MSHDKPQPTPAPSTHVKNDGAAIRQTAEDANRMWLVLPNADGTGGVPNPNYIGHPSDPGYTGLPRPPKVKDTPSVP